MQNKLNAWDTFDKLSPMQINPPLPTTVAELQAMLSAQCAANVALTIERDAFKKDNVALRLS
jgi:hypothetical protein